MAKSKRAKHEYVVGYHGEGNCVYGRRGAEIAGAANVDPLTQRQAMRAISWLSGPTAKATLYKLVPVETKTVAEWRKRRKANG